MPYVDRATRERLALVGEFPDNAGELNFVITCVVDEYLHRKGLSYAALNEVVGALECAKAELYRRIAAPYEDVKMDANGDVYRVVGVAFGHPPLPPVIALGPGPAVCADVVVVSEVRARTSTDPWPS